MKTELDICKGILGLIVRDFNLNRESIEGRQKATKTIYTLQATGMNIGYGFGWYKNGPYSQDLLEDFYHISVNSEYNQAIKNGDFAFSENCQKRISEINQKFIDGKSLRDLELMTSMHYMYITWRDNETPYEMKQKFREHHRDATFGDESPISDEQLQKGLIDACNLIAYKNYPDSLMEVANDMH